MAFSKWLAEARNLEELKTLYRKLARQHHPDLGGNTATMQEINTEYNLRTRLFEAGYVPASKPSTARPRKKPASDPSTEWGKLGLSKEAWEAYQAVCQMRNADPNPWGLVVEIKYGKVRVRGKASYYYRERLKTLGFYWDSEKRFWYFGKKSDFKKVG